MPQYSKQENIFDVLSRQAKPASPAQLDTDQVPEAVAAAKPSAPDYTSMKTADLVQDWQKNRNNDNTSAILKRFESTMNSALSSYAGGAGDKLRIKAANLTLKALETYDPAKGAAPETYVFHNLKRLSRYAMESNNIVNESEAAMYNNKYVTNEIAKFQDRYDREPSLQELADITGLSIKRLNNILNSNSVVSESQTLSEDSNKDTLANSDVTDDDYYEYVYASVGPIDQKIMDWTAGKHGAKVLSNNEIAAKLHISAPAVSQRRNAIYKKLEEVRGLI